MTNLTPKNYQVIEDNGGGMALYFFDPNDDVVLGFVDLEYLEPGELDNISYEDCLDWDNPLDDPQKDYDNITSYEFGWETVADQNGIYPDNMGAAAKLIYRQ